MVDKMLGKALEKTRNLIDRVGKGQADDAPIDLPGTFTSRDNKGHDRAPERTSNASKPANTAGNTSSELADRGK